MSNFYDNCNYNYAPLLLRMVNISYYYYHCNYLIKIFTNLIARIQFNNSSFFLFPNFFLCVSTLCFYSCRPDLFLHSINSMSLKACKAKNFQFFCRRFLMKAVAIFLTAFFVMKRVFVIQENSNPCEMLNATLNPYTRIHFEIPGWSQ